jgi:uncharacterized membrane protein HdeD (DUF308 family)
MKPRSVAPMRIAKIGYIVISVILCAVGVLFIALPEPSAAVLGKICGLAMILFGIVKLVGYWSKDLFRLAFQYDLEFGVLLLAIGGMLLIRSDHVMGFLSVALGVAILADGLFRIRVALDARRFGIGSWWLTLALAVAAALVGLCLVLHPAQGGRVLTVLLGASLLCEGVLSLDVALATVKIVKHQQPDVIEVDDYEVREEGRKD